MTELIPPKFRNPVSFLRNLVGTISLVQYVDLGLKAFTTTNGWNRLQQCEPHVHGSQTGEEAKA